MDNEKGLELSTVHWGSIRSAQNVVSCPPPARSPSPLRFPRWADAFRQPYHSLAGCFMTEPGLSPSPHRCSNLSAMQPWYNKMPGSPSITMTLSGASYVKSLLMWVPIETIARLHRSLFVPLILEYYRLTTTDDQSCLHDGFHPAALRNGEVTNTAKFIEFLNYGTELALYQTVVGTLVLRRTPEGFRASTKV
jgi:hypothetical protein